MVFRIGVRKKKDLKEAISVPDN